MGKVYVLYGVMPQSKREKVGQRGRELTDRQREIAELVCAGQRSKTIARKLGVSEGTIKAHLHAIYVRLRVKDRAGLMKALSG
jgi:DNA-binding NarL/FixJ family response regulator